MKSLATVIAILVCVFILTGCRSEPTNTSVESSDSSSSSYISVNTLENGISLPEHSSAGIEASTNNSPLASKPSSSSNDNKPSTKYYSGTYENPVPYGTWTHITTDLGEVKFRISGVYRNSAIAALDEPMLYFLSAWLKKTDLIDENYIPYAITYEIQAPSSFTSREYKPLLNFMVADVYGKVINRCQDTSMTNLYSAGSIISGSVCCFLPPDCLDTMPILQTADDAMVYFFGIDTEGNQNLFQ